MPSVIRANAASASPLKGIKRTKKQPPRRARKGAGKPPKQPASAKQKQAIESDLCLLLQIDLVLGRKKTFLARLKKAISAKPPQDIGTRTMA